MSEKQDERTASPHSLGTNTEEQGGKRLGSTLTSPELSLLLKWLRAASNNTNIDNTSAENPSQSAPDVAAARTNSTDETKKSVKRLINPDISQRRINKWKSLGWEVFERKALLLAAAKDLDENDVRNPLKLAATDIFVEKAQRALTFRGAALYLVGGAIAFAAVWLLRGAAWHVYNAKVTELLEGSRDASRAFLTILILKSVTAGSFVAAIAYLLIALARALLHEATVLFSRRHSLRFGRLFVYLMSDKMTREDLVAVFNWNAEFSTAFKDIQADQITKSALVRGIEAPGEMVKALVELVKPFAEKIGKKSESENGTQ